MGGLLKFLLIAICILYLIRVLARIFLPFLFKKAMNKMQEKMNQQYGGNGGGGFQYKEYHFGGNTNKTNAKPEGKISVDYVPPAPKNGPNLDKGGEFVDFEEVK